MSDNNSEELKDLLYKFAVLNDRWKADKLEWEKYRVRMEELMEELSGKIEEFGELKKETEKSVIATIYKASAETAKDVGDRAKSEIKAEVNKILNNVQGLEHNLKGVIESTEVRIGDLTVESKGNAFYGYVFSFVFAVVVSFIAVKFGTPAPEAVFTDAQLETYNQGKMFQKAWTKLEKWEQNRIMAISKGEPVPPVKEVNLTNKNKHKKSTNNANNSDSNGDDNAGANSGSTDTRSSNSGDTSSSDESQTSDGGSSGGDINSGNWGNVQQ